MREAVNVRAIRALTELRDALGRFAGTAKEALASAEIEIRRTQEWLREREAHWRREVERARWDYKECLRHQDEEWGLDCAAEKAALLHAEAELQKVQYWRARVERTIAEYRPYANRLKYLATDHTERARAFLDRRRAELEAYMAVPVPSAAQVVPGEEARGAEVPQLYTIVGSPAEKACLNEALRLLESVESGHQAARVIQGKGTTVHFGSTVIGAIAQYDLDTNKITIHQSLKDASPRVLAAHLAHEGTHVLWEQPNSIDQEYHAFKAQAKVWERIKGEESDLQCDWVSGMISLGEEEAKRIIRRLYPDLPEY
jgi:hypothetical protein